MRRTPTPNSIVAQGFTLIELLVVVLIIGIVLSFVSLSINTNSASQRLDREARRLEAIAQTAATDALLYGIEIGLDITSKGYRFVQLTDSGWQVLTGDLPLESRNLGRGLELVAVTVNEDGKRPQLMKHKGGEDQDDDAIRRRPEALFLSSGEIIPFTLELHAKGLDQRYRLIGHANGRIELKQIGGLSS